MDKLSNRVMALEGPDREIFIEAFVAIHGPKPERVHGGSRELTDWLLLFNPFFHLLEANGWLSAAEMLVPEGWSVGLGDLRGYDPIIWRAHLRDHNNPDEMKREWVEGHAATPALALCAAALKARGL